MKNLATERLRGWLVCVCIFFSAQGHVAMADSRIRVEALNCSFTIPGNYTVQAGSESTEFYVRDSPEIAHMSIDPIPKQEPDFGAMAKKVETAVKGHLKITRVTLSMGGNDLEHVVIQGLNEELRLDGGAAKEADAIVSECVATVPPFLLEAAKRRQQGCHPFSRDSFNSLLSQVRTQPVFVHGGSTSWRIYEGEPGGLAKLGLRSGDLATHFCGVPVREIVAVHGDICCSKQASTAIDVTLMRDGKTMDVAVPLAGKSG